MPRCSPALALALLSLPAHAAQAPAQPAPAAPLIAPAEDIPTAVARLLGAYRFGAIAERITFTAVDTRRQVTSDVLLRLDAGNAHTERPARLRLDMGRLAIYAEGDRLIAVHTQNNEQYFEATLEGGLSARALASVLPALPLPQLSLALDSTPTEELAILPAMSLNGAGLTTWTSAQPLAGQAGDSRVELTTTQTSRLNGFTITGPALTLRATIELLEVDDAKRPDLWSINTQGRTRVSRLTDLRALPGDVNIGDRVPTLGLHRHDLSGWSLTDALRSLQEQPPQNNATTAAAVICILPGGPIPTRNILAAQRSLTWLAREFDNQRLAGITTSPRLLAISVGVLDLNQITPAFVRQTREQLGPIADGATLFYWTSAGPATLRRIAPGATGAVVLVIDSQQRLLGVIPLDDTLTDETTIAREVRAIVSERLDPGNLQQNDGSGDSDADGSRSR